MFTPEQLEAYERCKRAAKAVGLGYPKKGAWVPFSDVLGCVRPDGTSHPMYIPNDLWTEYVTAFEAWLAIEPKERKDDRMRMSRGDYDNTDSWEEPRTFMKDIEL